MVLLVFTIYAAEEFEARFLYPSRLASLDVEAMPNYVLCMVYLSVSSNLILFYTYQLAHISLDYDVQFC